MEKIHKAKPENSNHLGSDYWLCVDFSLCLHRSIFTYI